MLIFFGFKQVFEHFHFFRGLYLLQKTFLESKAVQVKRFDSLLHFKCEVFGVNFHVHFVSAEAVWLSDVCHSVKDAVVRRIGFLEIDALLRPSHGFDLMPDVVNRLELLGVVINLGAKNCCFWSKLTVHQIQVFGNLGVCQLRELFVVCNHDLSEIAKLNRTPN